MARKYTTEEIICRFRSVHGDRYDYAKVRYAGMREAIPIICADHGPFVQKPRDHVSGSGCPRCAIEAMAASKTKSKEDILARFRSVHGEQYDYARVMYRGAAAKVTIVCPLHGSFQQLPHSHIRGSGCPRCGETTKNNKRRNKEKDVLAGFRRVHGDRYNYSSVSYERMDKNVTIVCRNHGPFRQRPNSHIRGHGCLICGKEKQATDVSCSAEDVLARCRKMHGDRYDYSETAYSDMLTKMAIVCPDHGLFRQLPYAHILGQGCPRCNVSHGERRVARFLDEREIKYMYQWRNHDCTVREHQAVFDFYLPKHDTIIEYDGEQHFMPVSFGGSEDPEALLQRVQLSDHVKNVWAAARGTRMVRIAYTDDVEIALGAVFASASC